MSVVLDHAPVSVALDPEQMPIPTGREEDWRFTPLKRLSNLHESATGARTQEWVADLPSGVLLQTGSKSDRPGFADRAAAAAWAAADTVTVLTIPANLELGETIVLRSTANTRTVGQLDVVVGANSRATVVLEHEGTGELSANVDIRIDSGASLTIVSVQNGTGVHLGHHRMFIANDASVRHVVATVNGELVRLRPFVNFGGTGGVAELLGIYLVDGGRHAETRLFVDHSQPDCRSSVAYKGALAGADSHGVWVGDVLIRGNATGTDTYEINRNLVLGDGARADSVPNLEIETGEIVGAGHASTTGRFDDEQLFYLTSRGIPHDEARRLVLRGFFDDILMQVAVPEVNEAVRARLEQFIEAQA